jgi:hypothetical protein
MAEFMNDDTHTLRAIKEPLFNRPRSSVELLEDDSTTETVEREIKVLLAHVHRQARERVHERLSHKK